MKLLSKALKGASYLSASEGINQVCAFLRNVILARFLTKADFGVAALLGMILTVFELTNKMSLGQLVVQSDKGDDPDFVNGVQFTQFGVGLLSAMLILLMAHPASHFLKTQHNTASIMALALIPLANGLSNLDLYRRARGLGFGWLVLCDNIPQVITTAAVWPLAVYFRDYRAMLCVMLGKAILSSAMSYLVSNRRSIPKFSPYWTRECIRFGWPLILAGFIQFVNLQGDSMVVAAKYSLSRLGEFDVAMTLSIVPGMACLRVTRAVGLPILSAVKKDPIRLRRRYGAFVEALALFACLVTLGMLFCGEEAVVLLFGHKYAGIGSLASWLIAGQALRLVRGATATAAMARGDTVNNMVSNIWRLCGLPLALVVAALHGSLHWFAFSAVTAEIIALRYSVDRLLAKQSVERRVTIVPALVAFGCVMVGVALKALLHVGPYSLVNVLICLVLAIASIVVFSLCFPELAEVLAHMGQKIHPGLAGLLPRSKAGKRETDPLITT